MANASKIDDLNQSFESVQTLLKDMNSVFKTLNQSESIRKLKEAPLDERINTLQLILQYRMDGQDSLVRLMQIEQSLLQALGVEHLASDVLNLENLAYALGREDFKLLLADLNALIDKLLKILYKHRLQEQHFQLNKKPGKQKHEVTNLQQKVKKVNLMQRQLISQLANIQQDLNLFFQNESFGPVRDHIIALRGPISRFYQLILSGLKQSNQLYNHLKPESSLTDTLEPILEKANDVLHQLSLQSATNHYFKPQQKPGINSEALEERAKKRRLRPVFFN